MWNAPDAAPGCRRFPEWSSQMLDIAYVIGTIGLFALVGYLGRALEKL